jgi:hypothetical protein
MTSEMTEKSYLAVRCFYCSEPIRLSARMIELCHFESDSTTSELQSYCQVFILRCDSCSKEIHYLKSQTEMFEEEASKASGVNRNPHKSFPTALPKAAGL